MEWDSKPTKPTPDKVPNCNTNQLFQSRGPVFESRWVRYKRTHSVKASTLNAAPDKVLNRIQLVPPQLGQNRRVPDKASHSNPKRNIEMQPN